MANATKNAADRGMVIEPFGSTPKAHQCLEGHDGAAYRIRTDDPLITKIFAREGESGKRLILSRQGEFTRLEILSASILFGKERQQ